MYSLSIIIPAKNEASTINELLTELISLYPEEEIIVVNDGSTDETSSICHKLKIKVIDHPYSLGNGGAIKSGARIASGKTLVFMDADGQHSVKDIVKLVKKLNSGYDMVVGARGLDSHAGKRRLLGNTLYNYIASKVVGQKIDDLTSGFRAINAKKFKEFLYLLPNGFSYPTTITMAFFRTGYTVSYIPINVQKRAGKSHLKILKDGPKFFLIILKIAALYSPLKIFTPASIAFFVLGLANYGYTYIKQSTFTNMSALLLITGILLFFIGLISEQMTTIVYALNQKYKAEKNSS